MTRRSHLEEVGRRSAVGGSQQSRRRDRNAGTTRLSHSIGLVTATDAGPPPTVTVVGRTMRYPSGYIPSLGDQVVFLGGRDPVVIARLAT